MHIFNVEVAMQYGLSEAVIINNFQFWLNKNNSDGTHFYDGHTWTYNTTASLAKLFPYMTQRAVRYAIDNLVKNGVLIKGNYNKSAYDRTNWYAFNNEREWLYVAKHEVTKTANGSDEIVSSHLTKTANGSDEIVQPIPDSKQQIVNRMVNKDMSKSAFDEFYAAYPRKENRANALRSWLKISPSKHTMIIADVINRAEYHDSWSEKKFIPLPASYLNQERWTDEISIKTNQQRGNYNGNNSGPSEAEWNNADFMSL
jgi:hypothetical protein